MKVERTKWAGIYRRGDRYVAVVSYTRRGEHLQKWVSGRTLSEVRERRDELLVQVRKGLRPHKGRQSLEDFFVDWLAEVKATRRPNTYRNYRSKVHRHILPALGGLPLAEVDRDALRQLYRELPGPTARNVHGILSSAFSFAVEEGLVAFNVCGTLKAPRYERREARHLEVEEARQMLEVARGHRLESAVIVGLVGGVRAAEACSLTWRDTSGGRIMVRGSWWGSTKSGKPRGFALPHAQVADLRRARRQQAEWLLSLGIRQDDDTPIVLNTCGQPCHPKRLAESFAAFCKEHRFDVSFHGLRHSAAILMLSSGVDPNTVAGRLGHSSAAFTVSRYGHYVTSADELATERLAKTLQTNRRPYP